MAFLKLSLSVFEAEYFINEPVVYCDFNIVPIYFYTKQIQILLTHRNKFKAADDISKLDGPFDNQKIIPSEWKKCYWAPKTCTN